MSALVPLAAVTLTTTRLSPVRKVVFPETDTWAEASLAIATTETALEPNGSETLPPV